MRVRKIYGPSGVWTPPCKYKCILNFFEVTKPPDKTCNIPNNSCKISPLFYYPPSDCCRNSESAELTNEKRASRPRYNAQSFKNLKRTKKSTKNESVMLMKLVVSNSYME